MEQFLRRTWLEINLNAIENNYLQIRNKLNKKVKIMCVVKADAYGHGSVAVAKEYESLGADWLAVANIDEALQLRAHGISLPILILGYTPPNMAKTLIDNNLTQSVISEKYAQQLSEYAVIWGTKVKVHLKIDTGMGRLGFPAYDFEQAQNVVNKILKIVRLKGLFADGMYSHFSSADSQSDAGAYTKKQFNNFLLIVSELRKKGVKFSFYHCANSAAILQYPSTHINMVRPGIILYGLTPNTSMSFDMKLIPAMKFKTNISYVKVVDPGTPISYSGTFKTQKTTKIATVPVGYADGYPRRLSNYGVMTIEGARVPIIGTVCMDQLMLDVSNIADAQSDDTVVIFGDPNKNEIGIDQVAKWCDTINYEIACNISKRVPRIYIKNNKIISKLNYINP
ncbi:MAG: alanine racemase [Clostridia bacterium]|nr:alanine racemase [Clostridia bacterium]